MLYLNQGLLRIIHLIYPISLRILRLDSLWLKFFSTYSFILQKAFGWLPFSVGDVYLLILVVWLLRQIVLLVRRLKVRPGSFLTFMKRIALFTLFIYAQFMMTWGLNYRYRSFQKEQNLTGLRGKAEVKKVFDLLLRACGRARTRLKNYNGDVSGGDTTQRILFLAGPIFQQGQVKIGVYNPFPRVKPSLYNYIITSFLTEGYVNPFTLEAQVNTLAPRCLLPFNASHELSHQAGYGFEYEASLVGYLISTNSTNAEFRYSAYFSALLEAVPIMMHADSAYCRSELKMHLDPLVRKDIRSVRAFHRKYGGAIAEITGFIYGGYLKANRQPQGLRSYSDFIPLLTSWYSKHGYPPDPQ